MADKTIVALYDSLVDAEEAVRDLESACIPRGDISLLAGDRDRRSGATRPVGAGGETADLGTPPAGSEGAFGRGVVIGGVVIGATTGGTIGAGAGLLAGVGALAIPGIGPVIAAGPIVALLAGTAAGAAAGGLLGALAGLGVPEEEANVYAEGVRRGGTLVAVKVGEGEMDKAVAALERHAPADIDERSAQWRESGWERFDEQAKPYSAERTASEDANYGTAGTTTRASPAGPGRPRIYVPGGGERTLPRAGRGSADRS